jgi:3-phenylpropionate/trans-cinnamate dioxygenase ferredoxin reductase subunit
VPRRRRVRYLIAGGGPAGTVAAQQIRGADPEGAIRVVGREPGGLYNRTLLSKDVLLGADPRRIVLRERAFYERRRIDLLDRVEVTAVDLGPREALLSDGSVQPFERLLVATGADPVRPRLPGADGAGVCVLRTLQHAAELRERAAEAGRALCVGGGFIGVETACALRELGLEIDLVMLEHRVWPELLPEAVAAPLAARLATGGIRVRPERAVVGFELDRGALVAARLAEGKRLAAPLAVLGLGVRPATGFLAGSGIPVGRGVLVGPTLESAVPGVFAAGDVAEVGDRAGRPPRLAGHWASALEQGRVAGANLAGQEPAAEHREPALFDTRIFELEVVFVGDPRPDLRVAVQGDLEEPRFIAFFLEGERLRGTVHVNRTDAVLAARALVRSARPVDRRALAAGESPF